MLSNGPQLEFPLSEYFLDPTAVPLAPGTGYIDKPPLAALGDVISLIDQQQPQHSFVHQSEWHGEWKQDRSPYSNLQLPPPSSVCQICGHLIQDQYVLKIRDACYHENCIRCCVCEEPLGDKCYEKNNQIYCSTHYFAGHSPFRCVGCKLGISPQDMVYKLKTGVIYHVQCHCCVHCGKLLTPGEQIVVDEVTKSVACLGHEEKPQPPPFCPSEPLGELKTPKLDPSLAGETCASSSGGAAGASGVLNNTVIPQYPFEMYTFGEMYSDDGRLMKRRGPRTTIKQNQLDVLNQIFSATPKPSKHARAKLALETGLSMRVIQVWFQNRRSKERRLKHLCNFLRHYEQKGLVPPPFGFNPDDGTVITPAGAFSPQSMQAFGVEDSQMLFDEDVGDLSN